MGLACGPDWGCGAKIWSAVVLLAFLCGASIATSNTAQVLRQITRCRGIGRRGRSWTVRSGLSLHPRGRCEYGSETPALTQRAHCPLQALYICQRKADGLKGRLKQSRSPCSPVGSSRWTHYGTRWGSTLRQSRIKPKSAEKQLFRKLDMEISPSPFLPVSWGTLQGK